MPGSYRSSFQEQDLAGFISPQGNETGAMVIKASKGGEEPVKCTSENDIFMYFGSPSASYPKPVFPIDAIEPPLIFLVKCQLRHSGTGFP